MIIIGIIFVLIRDINLIQYIFNYSSLLILIYILGFYGLRQDKIFRESIIDSSLPGKSKTSGLSDLRKSQIKKKLIQYIESNEAYLNPELSMNFLSEILNVPKHQLTEVLNSDIGKNFFKFINEYRVEAVKKYLSDTTNNYSIEAIGYECGFNSKSSFFTVFKKITGQTPFAYKQSLQK